MFVLAEKTLNCAIKNNDYCDIKFCLFFYPVQNTRCCSQKPCSTECSMTTENGRSVRTEKNAKF